MTILPTVLTVLAIYLSLMFLDSIWLAIVCKKFMIFRVRQFSECCRRLNQDTSRCRTVGVVFIALGCFIFAVNPAESLSGALLRGAVFRRLAYSIYDLTNLTFVVGYPVKFIFVDIAWGTFFCGVISGTGFFVRTSIGT